MKPVPHTATTCSTVQPRRSKRGASQPMPRKPQSSTALKASSAPAACEGDMPITCVNQGPAHRLCRATKCDCMASAAIAQRQNTRLR